MSAKKPPNWVRLGCLACDRDDYDGITEAELASLSWVGLRQVQSYAASIAPVQPDDSDFDHSALDWETHLGYCPDCMAASSVVNATPAVR